MRVLFVNVSSKVNSNMKRQILLALTLLIGGRGLAVCEAFCALTLQIETSEGQPARSTWLQLIDPSGKVVRVDQVRGGVFRLCDFGAGPHSLKIGIGECHPVTISNLNLAMNHPISLRVRKQKCEMYNDEHTGCELLARILEDNGRPISDARLLVGGHQRAGRSDEFGRILINLFAARNDIVTEAEGYHPKSIRVECQSGADLNQEIGLRKREK